MSQAKQSAKKGLGRSFGALLPKDFDTGILADPSERIQKIAVDQIVPNADQPRRDFDPEALKQLASSIKRYGILQPLVVTPHGKQYEIIAGERRWRASQLAGLKIVPTIVRSSKELERLEIALVENVQRVDLSPLEQAASIERLHHQFSLKYEEIAKRLGKAPSTITSITRLLQLPEEARNALQAQRITEGHARQMLALKGHDNKQRELLELITKHDWSVREAERFVVAFKAANAPDIKAKEVTEKIKRETPETKKLSKKLGVPVSIRHTAKGGKLEIGFRSSDQLATLIKSLLAS